MNADLIARVKPFYSNNLKPLGKHPAAVRARKALTQIHKELLTVYADDLERQQLLEAEFLTSQLADREAQLGETMKLREGRYAVDKVWAAGGGYIFLLCARDGSSRNKSVPKLVCRGTAGWPHAEQAFNSVRNNLSPQIARLAIWTNWSGIAKHLDYLDIRTIDVLGKSMGGAIAQQLAILLAYCTGIKVRTLTTVCSVGVGAAVNDFYKKHVSHLSTAPRELRLLRTGGSVKHGFPTDYVPIIGGVHLGHGIDSSTCNVSIAYLGADRKHIELPDTTRSDASLLKAFVASAIPHERQTTLLDFGLHRVRRSDLDAHLAMGERMEGWRAKVCSVIGTVTFRKALVESFADFARRMFKESDRMNMRTAWERRS